MKLRKILLLASMALAAAALAVPAAASAAVWEHEGVPVEEHIEFDLSGAEAFETPDGGMFCEAQATLTTEGGSTGLITDFDVSNEGCFRFGEFSKCNLVTAEAQGLPWTVDVNAGDLTVTDADVRRTFDAECPIEELESTVPELTVTLNEPAAIGEVEIFGEGDAHVEPASEEIEYTTFGSFQVDGEAAGTYGIG